MQILPAIDLRGGKCVRLRQGDFDQETVFGDDPVEVALRWTTAGADRLHLVDLDGARAGKPDPAVFDAVVTGTPHERFGQQVTAIVKLRAGAPASEDELRAACEQHIARYKLPRAFVFVDAILRSPSGKADYRWAKATAGKALGIEA